MRDRRTDFARVPHGLSPFTTLSDAELASSRCGVGILSTGAPTSLHFDWPIKRLSRITSSDPA